MKTTDRFRHADTRTSADYSSSGARAVQPGRPAAEYDAERVRRAREDEARQRWRKRRARLFVQLRFGTPRHLRPVVLAEFRRVWREYLAKRTGRRLPRRSYFTGAVRCIEMPGRWWPSVPTMLAELRLPVKASAVRLAMSERRAVCGLRVYRGNVAPAFRDVARTPAA